MKKVKAPPLDENAVAEWETQWADVPAWMSPDTYKLHGEVGLIRFLEDGKVVAYSLATELEAGLRKRLADFFRDSDSGRNYVTGRRIYTNRHALKVQVLIAGSDPNAQKLARQLKTAMIRLQPPGWTAPARDPRTFIRPRKPKPRRAGLVSKPRPYTGTIPDG